MPTVQPGGLVLVTGANGYIASVTIKTLLDRGYQVRGTVRSVEKHGWMRDYFGPSFSLVEIPELSKPGCFDEAVKGVDGIMQIAANVRHDPSYEGIVEEMKQSNINMLNAASKEASVKRVVVVSSIAACVLPTPGVPYKVTTSTWNDEAIQGAKQPWDGSGAWARATLLYCAGKTGAEQAAFEWMKENKPAFELNSVVPNVNFGIHVAPQQLGYQTSCAVLEAFVRGQAVATSFIPPQHFVNTVDTALLCLAGVTLEEVKGERLFAFAAPYGWKDILEIINRRFPALKKLEVDEIDEPKKDCGEVDNKRAEEVLRMLGTDGFKSLEDTVVEAVQAFLESYKLQGVPKNKLDDVVAAIRQADLQ